MVYNSIRPDHKALWFLLRCKHLNSSLSRWTLFIQEYAFDVIYGRGKDYVLADSLSRYPIEGDLQRNEPSRSDVVVIFAVQCSKSLRLYSKIWKICQLAKEFCYKILQNLNSELCPQNISMC